MSPTSAKHQVKVLQYNAIFEEEKSGGYSVWVPSLPGCSSQGDSLDEAMKNIKEAIELYLEESPTSSNCDDDASAKQYLIPISIQYA